MTTDNIGQTIENLTREFGPAAGNFIKSAQMVHMMEGNAGFHARSTGADETMAEHIAKAIGPDNLEVAKELIRNPPQPTGLG